MLSVVVLTNEVCIAFSDDFFVFASNGRTVWLCLVKSAERAVLAWFRDWDDNGCLPNRRNSTRCDGVVEECSEVFNSSGSKMCIAFSDDFFVFASNGRTVWLCLVKSAERAVLAWFRDWEVKYFPLISLDTNRVSREEVCLPSFEVVNC